MKSVLVNAMCGSWLPLLFLAGMAAAADITLYCKCLCPPHESIVLTVPKCTLCTKAFCIENGVCPNITHPSTESTSSSSVSLTSLSLATASSVSSAASSSASSSSQSSGASSDVTTATQSPESSAPTTTSQSPTNLTIQNPEHARAISHEDVEAHLLDTREEDDSLWVAECFQRGSYKDEVIIYIFIILVLGLLGWAALRPHLEGILQRYAGYLEIN
ncbi:hypothetical protein HDU81_002892 [Chytriomyces hyalinus]|nr:hypothetical protein HDU81_002892 [Chytriomyces hyalinus]